MYINLNPGINTQGFLMKEAKMLEQKQTNKQFVPGLVLTPEQRIKLIEEKVQRAEMHIKAMAELDKKLNKR
jgi:hypothetical protein